jgi:hypothetical protein
MRAHTVAAMNNIAVSRPSVPETQVVVVTAAVPARLAYDIARRVELLPRWASGLAAGVKQVDGEWYAESPMGRVRLVMAPENPFGVLDHDVTLPDGTTVHNAFRVVPVDGDSCVLTFVVVRLPGVSQESFETDLAHVHRDLLALRDFLESEALNAALAGDAVAGLTDALAGRIATEEDLDALLRMHPQGLPAGSLADVLSMPGCGDFEFEPPRFGEQQ